MSSLQLITDVLREAQAPMSAREIADRAGPRITAFTRSRTPWTVISRDLALEALRGRASRVRRVAAGRFELVAAGMAYEELIARKAASIAASGINPGELAAHLFPHQRDLVTWALRRGRAEPIAHTDETFPVDLWQRYASPVWATVEDDAPSLSSGFHRGKTDNERAKISQLCLADMDKYATIGADINPSDTLQFRSAREDDDERHICPLQLEVIRRAVRLWSNPGDVVLSPFSGIGSEGYVALQEGRRFCGCELKESYYKQMVGNMAAVAGPS